MSGASRVVGEAHFWDSDMSEYSLVLLGRKQPPHNRDCNECDLVRAMHHKVWLQEEGRFEPNEPLRETLIQRVEFRIKEIRRRIVIEEGRNRDVQDV